MSYNWINTNDYTMDTFLLFDRWILRFIMNDTEWYDNEWRNYKNDMAKALSRHTYIYDYCRSKAPECSDFLDSVREIDVGGVGDKEARDAELSILGAQETFVVYAYPEVMNKVNYIRNWSPERLYELVDLKGKVVLDVGAGTGRLTFAAQKYVARVYASEPCDTLREYMRDRIKSEKLQNIKVLDGIVTDLPFEDDTFDVVMSGHVVGDDYDGEIAEMTRVLKDGGWMICCNGDDEFKREAPNSELVSRGFEFFVHESCEDGIIYDYRKKVSK